MNGNRESTLAQRVRGRIAAETMPPRLPLIDSVALAERLGTTLRHVRHLVSDRKIPFIKVGHLVRFDPTEIDQWIKQHTVTPIEPRRSGPYRR